jgi:hypothetical protein
MLLLGTLLAQFGSGFQPPSEAYSQGSGTNEGALDNLETFLSTIIGVITVVGSVFFIVNFLLAALSWITAGGDSGKIQSARDKMVQSTIGLIVVIAGYSVVGLIGSIVGLDILNPGTVLNELIP